MIYKEFVTSIQEYIEITLGITDVKVEEYSGTEQIPYLFQDQFYFYQMLLRKQRVILVWPKQQDMTIRQIRASIEHMSLKDPFVICFEVLASYERRYLIEKKSILSCSRKPNVFVRFGYRFKGIFPAQKTHASQVNQPSDTSHVVVVFNEQSI